MLNFLLNNDALDSPKGDLGPASLLVLFAAKLFKINLTPELATEGVRFMVTGGKVLKYLKARVLKN